MSQDNLTQEVTEKRFSEVKKELEDFKAEIKNKVYAIKVEDKSGLFELIDFIENKAEWKALEALGVQQLHKVLTKCEVKSGGLIYVSNLEVEALYFFLNNNSGKGLDAAKKQVKMFKPVKDALDLVRADNNKLNNLEHHYVSLETAVKNGISIDESKDDNSEPTNETEQN